MSMKFPHRGSASSPARKQAVPDTIPGELTLADQGRACCCPARPVVRVIMPPSPSRPHSTELLLCGHHYRVSRAALEAAQATVCDLGGQLGELPAALGGHQARVG